VKRDSLGEELKGEIKEREHYEPGSEPYNPDTIDRIVSFYTGDVSKRFRGRSVELIEEQLGDEEIPNPDAFLDAIVARCSGFNQEEIMNLGWLIDPLIQAFYNQGHNCFFLDLTNVHCRPWSVLGGLRGKPDQILTVKYAGKAYDVGDKSHYCSIEYSGECSSIGERAKHSEFFLSGHSSWSVADHADFCVFHIESPGYIKCHALPTNTDFYVQHARSSFKLKRLLKSGFFHRDNHLYEVTDDGIEEIHPDTQPDLFEVRER